MTADERTSYVAGLSGPLNEWGKWQLHRDVNGVATAQYLAYTYVSIDLEVEEDEAIIQSTKTALAAYEDLLRDHAAAISEWLHQDGPGDVEPPAETEAGTDATPDDEVEIA